MKRRSVLGFGVPMAVVAITTWVVPAHAAPVPPPPPAAKRLAKTQAADPPTAADRSDTARPAQEPETAPPRPPPPPPPPPPKPAFVADGQTNAPSNDGTTTDGVPKWMWAGLGVSAGLAVGMMVGAVASAAKVNRIEGQIHDRAIASLSDGKEHNDIDPAATDPATGQPIDLCAAAFRQPPDEPGTVTNGPVAAACVEADSATKRMTGLAITSGVFAASAVVFGVLAGLRARRSKTELAKRERDVAFGVAPSTHGFAVGGRFRF